MKVYKFGGASIKSAAAIKNMCNIIRRSSQNNLLVVVSAMGKSTNHLEELLELKRTGKSYNEKMEELKTYHLDIIKELFAEKHEIFGKIDELFEDLEKKLNDEYGYSVHYDQVVSFGEIISSKVIHAYLSLDTPSVLWLDARNYIITDNTFREGKVNWDNTYGNIRGEIPKILEENIVITQGFIGGYQNLTTTLGREGSDFSAAIFASAINAESVTIWKDVPGILSGDPSRFKDVELFDAISYQEAAEMTYYGASVIHPKTIKPLANRNIPLYVRSFDNPDAPGTRIHSESMASLPPAIIIKENQSLISMTVKDFTFINEENLKLIFHELSLLNVKINMMQNSAITFNICIDHNNNKIQQLQDHLKEHFILKVKEGLRLMTVKNYNSEALKTYISTDSIVLEQRTLNNYQALVTD